MGLFAACAVAAVVIAAGIALALSIGTGLR